MMSRLPVCCWVFHRRHMTMKSTLMRELSLLKVIVPWQAQQFEWEERLEDLRNSVCACLCVCVCVRACHANGWHNIYIFSEAEFFLNTCIWGIWEHTLKTSWDEYGVLWICKRVSSVCNTPTHMPTCVSLEIQGKKCESSSITDI